jgi:hypothetical protein
MYNIVTGLRRNRNQLLSVDEIAVDQGSCHGQRCTDFSDVIHVIWAFHPYDLSVQPVAQDHPVTQRRPRRPGPISRRFSRMLCSGSFLLLCCFWRVWGSFIVTWMRRFQSMEFGGCDDVDGSGCGEDDWVGSGVCSAVDNGSDAVGDDNFLLFLCWLLNTPTRYMLRMFGPDAPFGSILSINPVVVILCVPIFGALFRKIPAFNVILAGAIISGSSIEQMKP